jgi:hypothetical protein
MSSIYGYLLLSAGLRGWWYAPTEADSLYYHIPLAKGFLQGDWGFGGTYANMHMYFPAATEVFLAIQLALHIPLGYFNLFAILALTASCYLLGRSYILAQRDALLFATTIGTLYGVVRWMHAQTVDIWLAAYYCAVLTLLQKPKDRWWYYINTGIFLGLLIGSKYSGPLFAVGIAIIYLLQFAQIFQMPISSFQRIQASAHTAAFKLLVGGSLLILIGGFWYGRNWWVTGNPVYPLDTMLFPGVAGNEIIALPVWKAYLHYPTQMIDGVISEFLIWPLVGIGIVAWFAYSWVVSRNFLTHTSIVPVLPLVLLALWNFLIFLFLPSGESMQLHVSQYRFAYVVIIPLILAAFVLAREFSILRKIVIVSTLLHLQVLPLLPYRPKVGILVAFIVGISLFFNRMKKIEA